ncbi:hypothetical protein Patl1_18954 [Pistacia atlantica]|uniref:Uncharacterized protein n=1 Tax=Pistacia atlantica TaxID=434234 RepID=A0ACC1BZZ9_9ROSI|nr:hypothetical protein Patl1_18954 [Pistacia atlantica]
MFEPQHFLDLQDNSTFGDPKSWLIGDDNSSPSQHRTHPSLGTVNSNVDRVLFKDLVEIVPLVQSLIDRKANSSFTRRGSVFYTKTPSRESLSKKVDPKGRNVAQSLPPKKKKDHGDKDLGKNANSNQDADSFSIFSSRALASDKEKEELVGLREEVEDLRRQLLEKDELLKSAESSKSEMNAVQLKLDELKLQVQEKDSLVKSTQLQLSDAKIKLADKQAALERIQWEAMTANKKVEKLQEELDSIARRDFIDDMETQKMEEARKAYIAAVVAAKEKQDEESIAAAASARLYLQSIVFRSGNFSDPGISEAYLKALAR